MAEEQRQEERRREEQRREAQRIAHKREHQREHKRVGRVDEKMQEQRMQEQRMQEQNVLVAEEQEWQEHEQMTQQRRRRQQPQQQREQQREQQQQQQQQREQQQQQQQREQQWEMELNETERSRVRAWEETKVNNWEKAASGKVGSCSADNTRGIENARVLGAMHGVVHQRQNRQDQHQQVGSKWQRKFKPRFTASRSPSPSRRSSSSGNFPQGSGGNNLNERLANML
jgi:hypothetical protein